MFFRFLFAILTALVLVACPTTTIGTQVFPAAVTPQEQVGIPVTGVEPFAGCGRVVTIPVVNDAFEQAVVEQTNEIRMAAGLSPLKRVESLSNSARYHAADMSANDYFDHNTYDRVDGSLVQACDTWSRINAYYANWQALAENIAAGQRLPEMAIEGWMNSPDHRHNILSDQYSEIGVGFFEGEGQYRYYWGQNFGRAAGRYPLVIEGEKARTNKRDVSVYIYGDWREVRFQVDDGVWTDWMPFQMVMIVTLPDAVGPHSIRAEMRRWGESASASDGIELVQ